MGTLVLKNPDNLLASFALSSVDSAITVYTSAVQNRNSPRMVKNLRWLMHLRTKIASRWMHHHSPDAVALGADRSQDIREEDDVELLGWKTRLIQRAGKGSQTSRTISSVRRSGDNRREESGSSGTRSQLGTDSMIGGFLATGDLHESTSGTGASHVDTGAPPLGPDVGNASISGSGHMFDFGMPSCGEGEGGEAPLSITSEALVSCCSTAWSCNHADHCTQSTDQQLNQFWDPSVLRFGSTDTGGLAVHSSQVSDRRSKLIYSL